MNADEQRRAVANCPHGNTLQKIVGYVSGATQFVGYGADYFIVRLSEIERIAREGTENG